MIQRGDIILLDTTAIIEAHRVRGWGAIIKCFRIETVGKCVEECGTGDPSRRTRVPVDVIALSSKVRVHTVPKSYMIDTALQCPRFSMIDPGEREVLAQALCGYDQAAVWYVSTQDGGAVRVGSELGILDRFVSLEEMTKIAGVRAELKNNFTEKWLSGVRTKIKLEMP